MLKGKELRALNLTRDRDKAPQVHRFPIRLILWLNRF